MRCHILEKEPEIYLIDAGIRGHNSIFSSTNSGYIAFNNVSVLYPHKDTFFTVIESFNLLIERNEFLCILGPSGCGKTTVLKLLAGFIQPSKGNLYFNGEIIEAPSRERSIISQQNSLFQWMTVIQNVEYGLSIRRVSKRQRRAVAYEYLSLVGLSKYADYYPKDLSGGMSQRVQIARAYANNPPVLLMDEPFASLDSFNKEKMYNLLLSLWEKEKKTVVFVTHDIEEALLLGDKILIMGMSHKDSVQVPMKVPFSRPRKVELVQEVEFLSKKNEIKKEISLIGFQEDCLS